MKKKVLLLITIMGVASILQQSSGYSSAQLNSETSVLITDSENALIALPKAVPVDGTIKVINNMSVPISLENVLNITPTDWINLIEPGEEAQIPIQVSDVTADVVFKFKWAEGNASIASKPDLSTMKAITNSDSKGEPKKDNTTNSSVLSNPEIKYQIRVDFEPIEF